MKKLIFAFDFLIMIGSGTFWIFPSVSGSYQNKKSKDKEEDNLFYFSQNNFVQIFLSVIYSCIFLTSSGEINKIICGWLNFCNSFSSLDFLIDFNPFSLKGWTNLLSFRWNFVWCRFRAIPKGANFASFDSKAKMAKVKKRKIKSFDIFFRYSWMSNWWFLGHWTRQFILDLLKIFCYTLF